MPPAAIASQVARAIDSACTDPVRSPCRTRNSTTMAGGNFGALPNPPRLRSYSPSSDTTAPDSASSSTVDGCSGAPRWDSSATTAAADSSSSSRWSAHAAAIDSSTCPNDGMPGRGCGG